MELGFPPKRCSTGRQAEFSVVWAQELNFSREEMFLSMDRTQTTTEVEATTEVTVGAWYDEEAEAPAEDQGETPEQGDAPGMEGLSVEEEGDTPEQGDAPEMEALPGHRRGSSSVGQSISLPS